MAARHVGGNPVNGVRKVRAPQRRVAGNARPSRDEDQCHSDDAAAGASRRRSETRQTPPGARPNRRAQPRATAGRGALPSPRVGRMSRRATGGPRWMAIRVGASRRDRTRLTDGLADATSRRWRGSWTREIPRPRRGRRSARDRQSSSGRNVWGAVQELQIGVAASRWPRGIGTRRSGSRHSTS
jgi:hypothetical protein